MRTTWVLAVTVMLIGCRETQVNIYSSATEARAHGAIERGWVPRLLPPSATIIREKHDMDTNECWGRFDFKANDRSGLAFMVTPAERAVEACVRDPGVSWWPLHGSPSQTFQTYKSKDDDRLFLKIDWHTGTAYYWRCSK
jgi:hypothetical protein